MITIVDYEMGNLRSVAKAFEAVGAPCEITRDPQKILQADKLVVPGVGAFKDCMDNLKRLELLEALQDFLKSGRPYLGICLGMQLLMESSEEGGLVPGLGIFKGSVKRFPKKPGLKVPHMGWNSLQILRESRLLADIPDGSYVYFVHSYYVDPGKKKKLPVAVTDYGLEFTACLEEKNICAVQFHPEKSQRIGLHVLKNFHENF